MSSISPDPDKWQELNAALLLAAADLRENGDFNVSLEDLEIDSTADLAKLIETSAKNVKSPEAGVILWQIFSPGLAWDEADGDPILGENIHQLVKELIARP